jgi:hypothetical protein
MDFYIFMLYSYSHSQNDYLIQSGTNFVYDRNAPTRGKGYSTKPRHVVFPPLAIISYEVF